MVGEQPDKHRSLVAATLPARRSASVARSIPSPVSDPASGRLARFLVLELSGRVRLTTTSTVRMQARCCFGLRRPYLIECSGNRSSPGQRAAYGGRANRRRASSRQVRVESRKAIGMTGADRHGRSCIPPSRGQTPNLSGDQVSSSRTASSPCSSGALGEPDR
jgi:hypothetical protein